MNRARKIRCSLVVIALCTSCVGPLVKAVRPAPEELRADAGMVQIPGAGFSMGFDQGAPDEYPAHEVEIDGFFIDRDEVQNAHYKACVQAKGCEAAPLMKHPEFGRARHPVVGVTWRDAQRYCKWVEKRLPTEAEWELASRAPEMSYFPWAARFDQTRANARGKLDGWEKTAPVGSFPAGNTSLGVRDMAGNAAEWTADWYDSTYYESAEPRNPKGPTGRTGTRVVRGGSWADSDFHLRTTARASANPNQPKDSLGFRCAR